MISDMNNARMKRAADQLQSRVVARLAKYPGLVPKLMEDLEVLIAEHRRQERLRGLQFPKLVAVPLRSIPALELVPAEATPELLKLYVADWQRKHPSLTQQEIASAIAEAFPRYRAAPLPIIWSRELQPAGPMASASNEAPTATDESDRYAAQESEQ